MFLKKIKLISIVVLVNFILILVAAEIGIRLYKIAANPGYLESFVVSYLQPSLLPDVPFENKPNYIIKGMSPWDKDVECRFNGCNFRGSGEECDIFRGVAPRDATIVVMIGDSYTVNCAVPGTATYSKVAERYLRDRGLPVRVFNFGTAAGNSQGELAWLKHKVLKNFKPDVVVWQFLLNDYFPLNRHSWHPIRRFFSKYSLTYRFVTQHLQPEALYFGVEKYGFTWPRTYSEFREHVLKKYNDQVVWDFVTDPICSAAAELAAAGVPGIFLYMPFMELLGSWSDYSEDLRKLDRRIMDKARSCGWRNVIYATPTLSNRPLEEVVLDIKGDHHTNIFGAAIVGEFVGREIERTLIRKSEK